MTTSAPEAPPTSRQGDLQSGLRLRSERTTGTMPALDVVIPVHNEERDLEPAVRRLRAHLEASLPFPARITIADNASTDATADIGMRLAAEMPGVRYIRLNEKGRGRALAAAWQISQAGVVAYTDVDLSTDLGALLPLVAPLITGDCDVAIGSRLAPGARVRRGLKREVISRCYNVLLQLALGVRFRDAQCGFKAVRADVVRQLVPRVENRSWFFDTELLVLAQRAGLRIREVPVDWTDDPDSQVAIVATAIEDLRGVWRLMHADERLRFLSFAGIGVASTAAYAALYLLLHDFTSTAAANAGALALTALGNTAANRRFTFGLRGRERLVGDYTGGLVAFGIALAMTGAAAGALHFIAPNASHPIDLAVLTAANAAATVCRYLVLRRWMDSARPHFNLWRTAHQ